ncbi:bifunctional DNA primase/polymerase [Niabella aurantiaca]|uniref:bifunctional DNA primase/polymerase n=1 Tax=Niabella aurantiaca TaxID=379900 RepID=UPI00035DCF96|nr:bifunctional DNA primase/polymerase [Niabella aurantiaca]
MSKRIEIAKEYIKSGVSVIATDANKRAVLPWKKYELNFATDDDLKEMFGHHKTEGIAVLCGRLSGNLEVIDIDCKYDTTKSLFQDYIQEITDANSDLAQRLVIAKTKGNGYHIYYRCPVIEGNKKLAQRFTTDEEKAKNPHEKVKVLIETRGQSGYVIAPPTTGYKFTQGDIGSIPEISEDERRVILEIARSFNKVIEEYKHHDYTEKKPFQKSPFSDYNDRGDIVGLLNSHGWKTVKENEKKVVVLRPGETTSKSSGDFNREMNLFSVFTTSSEFEPNKGYKPSAVFAMLECGNDWKVAAKKLLEMGYGEPFKKLNKSVRRDIARMQDQGLDDDRIAQRVALDNNMTPEAAKQVIKSLNKDDETDDFWFWDKESEKLSLVYTRFVEFLNAQGFGLFFYDKGSPIFKIVKCVDNILEETTTERIKKHIEGYVKDLGIEGVEYTEENLLEKIYHSRDIFSDSLFEFLKPINIDFLKDTKTECFIPYRNGIVRITKDEIKLFNHGGIHKVIWDSDLIDFNVDISQDDDNECEFSLFVEKITGDDQNRLLQAISLIGYVLHKYKDPARPYAVILGEETEDESKGGGTGKGIFTKAFEHMMPVVTIDGKTFSPNKKNFAYQRIKLNTRAVILQDVIHNFDFQALYNLITEGATIEKKNQDELFIPYKDSPKLLVTTNYAVNDNSNHSKRRLKIIEFASYFSPDKTPLDEFGHLLFDDWDNDEWNRFYNFMFFCIRYYLKNGIVDLKQSRNYKLKKLKSQWGEEFVSWFEDYSANGCSKLQKVSDLREEFLTISGVDGKEYSMKRFKKAVKTCSENFSLKLVEKKVREDGNRLYMGLDAGNGISVTAETQSSIDFVTV